jgi:hypothetical protein
MFPAAVAVAGLLILFGGISMLRGWSPEFGIIALVVFLRACRFRCTTSGQKPGTRLNDFVSFTKNMAFVGASLMFLAVQKSWR